MHMVGIYFILYKLLQDIDSSKVVARYNVNITKQIMLKSAAAKREHIYGVAPCVAALLASRRKVHRVYLNEKLKYETPKRDHLARIIQEVEAKNHNVKYKSKALLDRLSGGHLHQNVVISASRLNYLPLGRKLEPPEKDSFWLALDQIHDPMNLGAIIRSAAYFGVQKIIVTEKNSCILSPVVSKTSSGAMEYTPIHCTGSMKKFLKNAKSEGWNIIGTQGNTDESIIDPVSCQDVELNEPTILLFGNEGFGLNEELLNICSSSVTVQSLNPSIPQTLDSLNVSVAAGVILHSLLSKRTSTEGITRSEIVK